jgi:tRNA (cmo5U34)-methyltransferase
MDAEQLKSTFDQQAPGYDRQWAKLAAFRDGLHLLIDSLFAPLPADARVLCVGAGTGAEIVFLAARHPGWTFTAVEPSAGMLEVCRQRLAEHGFGERCSHHQGVLETLPAGPPFDAATSLLVSQFILAIPERTAFFAAIAGRLRAGGLLASSDLSFDTESPAYPGMLAIWLRTMAAADVPPDGLERMRAAYARDVAILPPGEVEALLTGAGFDAAMQIYQAGLIRAWSARRAG